MSFRCPDCASRMKCIDTRDAGAHHGHATRRRYACPCGKRVSTIEMEVHSEGAGHALPKLIGSSELAEIRAAVARLDALLG